MSGLDVRVGSMRPSQLMWSYGIGAMVDLPRLSVMVEGLDQWATDHARVIAEDRLLAAVRRALGPQVQRLYEPPLPEEEPFGLPPSAPEYRIGVPVGIFPKWLRCPRCKLLSDADSKVFAQKGSSARPDEVQYVHEGCSKRGRGRPPSCVPARFLTACRAGHLDDFPWREFVHRGPTSCEGTLRFYEVGSSLETANLYVACDEGLGFSKEQDEENHHGGGGDQGCGMRPRSMVDAFGQRAIGVLPVCRGRHPHLRDATGDCGRQLKTILLGSSSSWFPKAISALSIPTGATELEQAVEDAWTALGEVKTKEEVAFLRRLNQLKGATRFSDEEVFAAVQDRKSGHVGAVETEDMKLPEWQVLSDPEAAPSGEDFLVTMGEAPARFDDYFEPPILVEKIREVNALIGFTRLEAPEELLRGDDDITYAPLSINDPTWVPANEVRGEGILVRFKNEAIAAWERRITTDSHLAQLVGANSAWRAARDLDPNEGYPGHRHVLLHTFSHLLMRELALECGYSASSIRERIYASSPELGDMAGVLIYTAAPDSEGTLGGLVRLGEPKMLGKMIEQALIHAQMCAADPLCSEHDPVPDRVLHAAACHACLFAPETGCEQGNRFLDRAVVVPTLTSPTAAFFQGT